MAFSLGVAPVSAVHSGSTITLTLTGTLAGQAIIAGAVSSNVTISSITCSSESDLTLHGDSNTGGDRHVQLASLATISSGGTKTITITFSGTPGFSTGFAFTVAGGKASGFFDNSVGASGTSTTPTVNITTANDGALVVAIAHSTGGVPTADGLYVSVTLAGSVGRAEYDLDGSTAGSRAANFTAASGSWAIRAAAFNPDPGIAVGAATGTGAATGVGAAIATGVGAAAGVGTAASIAGGTVASTGTASGVGAAVAVGETVNIFAGSAAFSLYAEELFAADLGAAVQLTTTRNLPVTTVVAILSAGPATLAEFDLPVATLESALLTGDVLTAEFNLASLPSFLAEMSAGIALSAEFRLPVLTLSASLNDGAVFNLPVMTLEAALLAGAVFQTSFRLPVLSISSALSSVNPFIATIDLPVMTLTGSLLHGVLATAAFDLPSLRMTGQVSTGELLTAAIDLPVIVLSAGIGSAAVFTATFNLPVTQLDARMIANLAANYRTWVLNTRKGIPTEYDWEFVGYAVFNGQVLAVGPAGVVVLGTQGLDGAAEIDARVRVANSDFDTSYLKRVPRIFTGLQQDGDMIFRTISSESGVRSYSLPWLHTEGFTQRRVPVGKGPKSRFWQFEWANVDGADFSVKDLLVYPTVIGRRSQ